MPNGVDVSCGTQTPAGKFLGQLYFDNTVNVFNPDERRGFPNDGSRHTLVLTAPKADIRAFVVLIKEMFGPEHSRDDFIQLVESCLNI